MARAKSFGWVVALLACVTGHAFAQPGTAADRLLEIAKAGKPVSPARIRGEVDSLLTELGAAPSFRERFALMGQWDVTAAPGVRPLDSVDHAIVIAPGPVTVKQALFTAIIAAGDVRIESGAGLVVVSGGNVTFAQDPEREWAGIFVSKGKLTAHWLARAALHAGGGATVRSNSIDVLAYNTEYRGTRTARLELRSGKPLFSADRAPARKPPPLAPFNTDFEFVGERCDSGVPVNLIAERIPKMAREKTRCSDLDLLVVTCRQDAATAKNDEIWTVHACRNVLVDIRARMVGGSPEVSFVPPPAPSAAVAVAVPPKYDPARTSPGYAVPQPTICPAPRPPLAAVDQLERSYDRTGFGFTRSALAGRQVASYFAVANPLVVSRLEWSGSVQQTRAEEQFVVRIFRDDNGVPGSLVHEATVMAQARSARKSGYQGYGHPHVFSASLGPINLSPGQYWLSVIDPNASGLNFMWGVETGVGSGQCGSGGTWRQGEKEPWVQIYASVPNRSARGYSFRLLQ